MTAFATAGQLAALSRSVATAARIEHRLGTEQALVVAAGSSIGEQIGASAVIDDMLNPGVIRIRPIPRAPRDTETALELPWRLQISPNPNGGFAHRTEAVEQAGRVELWHSRLGVRAVDGDVVEIDEDQKTYRTVRAIWTRDHDRFPFQPDPAPEGAFPNSNGQDDEPDYRMALNSRDRMLLVHETSNFGLTRQGDDWTPPAVDVDRLMLTSLGGWLSSQVMIPELPDGPFTIQEWKHRATMARDHEVKVVYAGFLWPFGHKASLVKVTERKFAPTQPGQPGVSLPAHVHHRARADAHLHGRARVDDDSGKRLDLVMPFKSVTFVTRVTPNLDEPDKLKRFGTNTAFGGGVGVLPRSRRVSVPLQGARGRRRGQRDRVRRPAAVHRARPQPARRRRGCAQEDRRGVHRRRTTSSSATISAARRSRSRRARSPTTRRCRPRRCTGKGCSRRSTLAGRRTTRVGRPR